MRAAGQLFSLDAPRRLDRCRSDATRVRLFRRRCGAARPIRGSPVARRRSPRPLVRVCWAPEMIRAREMVASAIHPKWLINHNSWSSSWSLGGIAIGSCRVGWPEVSSWGRPDGCGHLTASGVRRRMPQPQPPCVGTDAAVRRHGRDSRRHRDRRSYRLRRPAASSSRSWRTARSTGGSRVASLPSTALGSAGVTPEPPPGLTG